MRRANKGFSLIELMVVVAIIMVLAAIAVPNFLTVRQRAYEASAAGMLRVLNGAQEQYRISYGEYADHFEVLTEFAQAAGGGSPPGKGGGGPGKGKGGAPGKGGGGPPGGGGGGGSNVAVHLSYIFRLNRPAPDQWNCTAEPVRDRGSAKYFYIDHTGLIRYEAGRPATNSSPPF